MTPAPSPDGHSYPHPAGTDQPSSATTDPKANISVQDFILFHLRYNLPPPTVDESHFVIPLLSKSIDRNPSGRPLLSSATASPQSKPDVRLLLSLRSRYNGPPPPVPTIDESHSAIPSLSKSVNRSPRGLSNSVPPTNQLPLSVFPPCRPPPTVSLVLCCCAYHTALADGRFPTEPCPIQVRVPPPPPPIKYRALEPPLVSDMLLRILHLPRQPIFSYGVPESSQPCPINSVPCTGTLGPMLPPREDIQGHDFRNDETLQHHPRPAYKTFFGMWEVPWDSDGLSGNL